MSAPRLRDAFLVTRDLQVSSRLSGQLQDRFRVTTVSDPATLVELLAASSQPLLLIDLSGSDAESVLAQLAKLRSLAEGLEAVAFGPHVQTERLKRAREAGCDVVLTRGQILAGGGPF